MVNALEQPKIAATDIESGIEKKRNKQPNFFNSPNMVPFPKVVDGNVSVEDFLEAYLYFMSLYELLGSLFEQVTKLEKLNITRIRSFYMKDPAKHKYIKDLVLSEKKQGKHLATDTFVWLKRTVQVFSDALDEAVKMYEKGEMPNMNALCYESYKKRLQPYHSFFYRQLFKTVLLVFLPSTESFAKCVCFGQEPENNLDILREAKQFFNSAIPCLQHIEKIYKEHDLDLEVRA